MKLSELNFKVILDTVEKRRALQEALFEAGGAHETDTEEMLIAVADGCWDYWPSTCDYNLSDLPELTYAEAMAEIAKVETKPKGKWVDFDVNADGYVKIDGELRNIDRPHYIICNEGGFKAFGGIQYIEPVSGGVSQFVGSPFVCWYEKTFHKIMSAFMAGDGARFVLPHKIRFWMEV